MLLASLPDSDFFDCTLYQEGCMKRSLGWVLAGIFSLASVSAVQEQPFPKTLLNARYVYVRAYDGDLFNRNLLPEDRAAIQTVQDELRKWGRFIVVYHPRAADLIIMVMSRRSEDVLAVYDGRLGRQQSHQWLWRAMGPAGEGEGEAGLVERLRRAVETAESH
jgi:hypothetical protein